MTDDLKFSMFTGESCAHCGCPEWSGFQCCDDCAAALAAQFEREDAS